MTATTPPDEPIDPVRLRPSYTSFLRDGRVLLTGHSHQAWPDVAREGLLAAFEDAALHVDDKWERARAAAIAVRQGVIERIGGRIDDIALAASTHELVMRFLSALDLRTRPHFVTTEGEFHSLHRQLSRLAEEGFDVTGVAVEPIDTLAERLASEIRDDTAALCVSTVLFETSAIVPGLRVAVEAAQRAGAEVLLDAYHAFNVVPFRIEDLGPDPIFVTGGGYKYAEWGEGCCFMRVPPGCELRPIYTGWYSDFASLTEPRGGGRSGARPPVSYGKTGADRFAGSTYDPSSHYRARAVIRFFRDEALGVERLRALSMRQTARIVDALAGRAGLELASPHDARARGGFVSFRVERAAEVVEQLRAEGVLVDARGNLLRMGPAPYVTDDEIDLAVETIVRCGGTR